jgi:hypothetical protein
MKHANAGSFRRGPDPRRHVFTKAECSRGYRAALDSVTPQVRRHLRESIQRWYARRRKLNLTSRRARAARPPRSDPPW